MAIGKKGIIFTFMAIALLFVTITFMYNQSRYQIRENPFLQETKIVSMDRFITDTETDLERALFIASFRAIIGMNDYIKQKGVYIDGVNVVNLSDAFETMVLNGTMNGTNISVASDSHLTLWAQKMSEQAAYLNLDFTLELESVELRMISPWTAESTLNATLEIEDIGKTAKWRRHITTAIEVSILGFLDPVYTMGSQNRFLNNIKMSPYHPDYTDALDVTNLESHWRGMYYSSNPGAPDYLHRLAGLLTNTSDYGIESLVNTEQLLPEMYQNKSVVDHIFWSASNPIDCPIVGMPSGFRIDNETLRVTDDSNTTRFAFYGVEDPELNPGNITVNCN
ncbi:MAG: hypothetical protein ABIH34_05875 [Nanoarchaeota archaeon]